MSQGEHPAATAPATVVLATDLGPRCDRAAARAARLAADHGASAMAVTALEPGRVRARDVLRHAAPAWHRRSVPVAHAERALRRQLAAGLDWHLRVAERETGDHLDAVLDALDDDTLVVAGPVREGVIGPTVLGSTVDRLLRRPAVSLLLVREWVRADYRHVLVASDFSAPSAYALRRARALFVGARFTLLHGFTLPMLGLRDGDRDGAVAEARQRLQDEGAQFLAGLGAAGEDMDLVIEYGDPARLAQQYVDTFDADLVVVGTHGRGAMYELAVGSVARRVVAGANTDTLVVRGGDWGGDGPDPDARISGGGA